MDIIKKLQENKNLADLLYDICDIIILPQFISPQEEDGSTHSNKGSDLSDSFSCVIGNIYDNNKIIRFSFTI